MTALVAKCLLLPLLAQRDAWESLGSRFSGKHAEFTMSDLWSLAAVVAAGVALVWLLHWLYRRQQRRRLSCEPRHLFADLCRAHRLNKADRKRLIALAEQHDLASPAHLFVRRDLFDFGHSPHDAPTRSHLLRLEARLFAGLEEVEAGPSESIGRDAADPSSAVVAVQIPASVDASTSTV